MDAAATGRGHSLWLMPEAAEGERLAGWIRRLAERFRSEGFPPHVTLLSALEGRGEDLLATAGRAAAALRPFTVHVDGVSGRDEHFRCVFVQAAETGPLRAAHEAVSRAFGREPDPGFFPHLSLVYGSLRADRKQDLALEIGSDVDVHFEARRVHLWRSDGPVAAWQEVGAVPLARC
jgi:2'-5' RNA ligase